MGTPLPLLDSPIPSQPRKPEWLKVRAPGGPSYLQLRGLVRRLNLHTVCEEARCPNIGECWEERTATFMILGDVCTRRCSYCAVAHGRPTWEDRGEPERVADAVRQMGLDHVVVTSVNRDDLADGGASVFAATILAIRRASSGTAVEVLIPDFRGSPDALEIVLRAGPEILNHNIETVPRLFPKVRPGGRYDRSLEIFRRARVTAPHLRAKSGIIVGMGEDRGELIQTMRDLRAVDVGILTLGQYLRPSPQHLPVARYYRPDEFLELQGIARSLGFCHVEAGPLVRSSYHARRQAQGIPA